ncbi:MAG: Gfo/Idh/MocA family oxidoreductase [Acidimicrobiia bacterium]|nr:MAG: Gfo/Idh/MocA family oxidoreductase [Acidimicrobiia bacterium]
MKVGIIGAGRIGAIHADNLSLHPAVSAIIVTDPILAQSQRVATSCGGNIVEDAAELLESVDAVVISTPADKHAELIELAVDHRVPAFCEKPLAMNLADADRAVAAVTKGDVPVQMGFNRRFDPGYRRARDLVAGGDLGDLTLVIGQHHDYELPTEDYIARSGGEFRDQLIHDFDILRFVTDREVIRVHAAGATKAFDWFAELDDYAQTAVTLWLDDGTLAVLCGSRHDPVGYDVRMEVFGTKDSIAVGLDGRTPLRSVEPGAPQPTDPYTEWIPRFGETYASEMDAFLEMVGNGGPNECTVQDARAALVIAEACTVSAREGRIVTLNEVA